MAEVFVGQIMLTGFNFPPKGFAQCNGQLLPLNQNPALFALLGVAFGGNGTSNFALPNLQGRAPLGGVVSSDPSWQPPHYSIGQTDGAETVQLSSTQLPQHSHLLRGSTTTGTNNTLDNAIWGKPTGSPAEALYAAPGAGALTPLDPSSLTSYGGGGAHQNMQPFLVVNFNIALTGYFPSRN